MAVLANDKLQVKHQHNYQRISMLKTIRQHILNVLPTRLRFALRYMAIHKRFSLLLWPRTFTEKVMLRIAKDRRSLLRTCADKLAMRRYVEQKVGPMYLPKILCNNVPPSINWKELPERFVIKASHGSTFVSVVAGFNPLDTARIEKLVEDCKSWLAVDYGRSAHGAREWAYVDIPRYILIEEFIESNYLGADGVPWDFKCFVFDGRCAMIEVVTGRYYDHRCTLFSRAWERFDSDNGFPYSETPLERPANLGELIELAEKVGAGIDFVRVDVYAGKNGPLVGEMTMTPGGGMEHYSNPKLDRFLGSQWKMAGFRDQ